jgi:hypothetical protein
LTKLTAYHQLGKFIVDFQHIETSIIDLLLLLTEVSNSENTTNLIKDFGYSQLVNTADAMFGKFVDSRLEPNSSDKECFRKLMDKLLQLGKRRNELVHSSYMRWVNIDGNYGLIRNNLKPNKVSNSKEEELLPEAFNKDLEELARVHQRLEEFRLKVIDYLYPEITD